MRARTRTRTRTCTQVSKISGSIVSILPPAVARTRARHTCTHVCEISGSTFSILPAHDMYSFVCVYVYTFICLWICIHIYIHTCVHTYRFLTALLKSPRLQFQSCRLMCRQVARRFYNLVCECKGFEGKREGGYANEDVKPLYAVHAPKILVSFFKWALCNTVQTV